MIWNWKQAVTGCGARTADIDYFTMITNPYIPAYTKPTSDGQSAIVVFNHNYIGHPIFYQIMIHELGHVVLGHYKVRKSTLPHDVALGYELLCDKISEYGCKAINAPFDGKATTYMALEATPTAIAYVAERDSLARSAAQQIVDAGLVGGVHATVR